MNVALVGFGTVGQAVARILTARPGPLTLTHICTRGGPSRKAAWVPDTVTWTDRFDDLLDPRIDAIVEVIGGLNPAGPWIRQALEAGKSVVTANKQLLAQQGGELLALAAAHGRHLGFEASVAGGIPVIRAVREGLAGDSLARISGILNGTCNYILTRMASARLPFAAALQEAQEKGFAEADPTDDLEGYDARAKLCILARVGLGVALAPEQVACRSIRPVNDIDFTYGERLGCTIRQVSRVERPDASGRVVAWVQPALVRHTSPLARVVANQNLVVASGDTGGDTTYSGFGAGGGPTAVAVVSDLLAIADRGPVAHAATEPAFDAPSSSAAGHAAASRASDAKSKDLTPRLVTDRFPAPYYVRFIVRDRPGIIASIAASLAQHGINLDAVLQEPSQSKAALPFVITLEECDPDSLAAALTEIAALDFHVEAPLAMPILE